MALPLLRGLFTYIDDPDLRHSLYRAVYALLEGAFSGGKGGGGGDGREYGEKEIVDDFARFVVELGGMVGEDALGVMEEFLCGASSACIYFNFTVANIRELLALLALLRRLSSPAGSGRREISLFIFTTLPRACNYLALVGSLLRSLISRLGIGGVEVRECLDNCGGAGRGRQELECLVEGLVGMLEDLSGRCRSNGQRRLAFFSTALPPHYSQVFVAHLCRDGGRNTKYYYISIGSQRLLILDLCRVDAILRGLRGRRDGY